MGPGERKGSFDVEYPVTSEVGERIRAILAEAEAAAAAIRHEAEQHSQQRRRAAEEEAREYLAARRREADEEIADRIRRMSELSDTLWTRAEGLVGRFEQAENLRRQLGELIELLGHSAETLATQVGQWDEPARPAGAAPEPAPTPAPEPAVARPVSDEPVDAEVVDAPDDEELAALHELRAVRDQAPAQDPAPEPEPTREQDEADGYLAARLVALQMAVAGGNRGEVEGHLRRAFDRDSPRDILDDIFGEDTGPEARVAWPETTGKRSGS